jgi:molybdate transport system substrate-binding protein
MQTELRILVGGAFAAPMRGIAASFEQASGNRLVLYFGTTPELIKEATSGTAFDAALAPRDLYADAAARARFSGAPLTDVARTALGLAVRKGAVKPNIETPEAMKTALLNAQSLATIPASAAGTRIMRLFEDLGISDAMAAKTQVKKAPADVIQAVTSGEAEFGMFLANVFQSTDTELVTPFPAELQHEVVFAAAIAAETKHASATEAFIAYLKSPSAISLIKEKGMTPA